MAKITRKQAKIFGGALSAGSQQVEQFGSKVGTGTPNYTVDPDVIQSLTNWVDGWVSAIDGGTKAPYVQDMNAVCLVLAYQIAYLLQQGIPEWNAATTYYTDSVVQVAGQWYTSLQDNNTGNAPVASTTNSFWLWANPPEAVIEGAPAAGSVLKVSGTAAAGGAPGSKALVVGLLSDDGTYVIVGGVAGVNGIKFPDGTIQKTAATNPNAYTVQSPPAPYAETSSRVYGAVYQNTGTKPRQVQVVTILSARGTTQSTTAVCDGNPAPTQVVGKQLIGSSSTDVTASLQATITFIVLPGNYYKVTGGTKLDWIELT